MDARAEWNPRQILPPGLPAPIDPDRGGYTVTMRESAGAEEALALLGTEAPAGKRVHVGWGSFRNLDIAAARRSAAAVLLDINRHQFRVWEAVRAALLDEACTDPVSFVEIVAPLLPHRPRLRQFVPDTKAWLLGDLDRAGSWLNRHEVERFAWIRGLFRDDLVATGCIDLRAAPDADLFAAMARRIDCAAAEQQVRFDTLYVSNLPWMLAQREGFFGESHADFAPAGEGKVVDLVHRNLGLLAPRFRHVVSAAQLAQSARPDDLQWHTEVLDPASFLGDAYWARLEPVSGAFRSLR